MSSYDLNVDPCRRFSRTLESNLSTGFLVNGTVEFAENCCAAAPWVGTHACDSGALYQTDSRLHFSPTVLTLYIYIYIPHIAKRVAKCYLVL